MNMHQPPPSLFNRLAPKLRDNHWRPLPGYQDTKRPSINGWNFLCDLPWNDNAFREVMLGRGKTEGKMVCLAVPREIVAIDIDVEDEAAVQLILDAAEYNLGVTPLRRIGRQPRCLLVYRSDGSIKSRKYHPIEIFSGSGQFVAFGFHTGANRDYQWPHLSPLELRSDDPSIPEIGSNQLMCFMERVWQIIPKKESVASDYIEALYAGDTLVQDRQDALFQISQKVQLLADANEGQRNETLFHVCFVAGQAIAAGLVRKEEIEEGIIGAAQACGLLTEDEQRSVFATMRSGFEKGARAPFFVVAKWFEPIGGEAAPEPVSVAPEAKETNDPFDYYDTSKFEFPPSLVKNLLPKTGVAFIGGQSGAGKTFLAVDLAIALATGQPFFGRKVKEKVGVAILAGEGAETLRLRMNVAAQARNIDDPLPIAWMPNVPNLADSRHAPEIMAQLRRLGQRFQARHGVRLGVVIFDTLAATFLLENENDNSEAAKITKVLQNISFGLGVLCVPVHHYGKGAETGLRGASAWRAGSDAVLSVTADRNQLTGVVSNHSLWLAKSRVGEEGPVGAFSLKTMFVGLDEDDEEVTSCYVVPEVVKQISVEERKEGEALLMEMLGEGGWRESAQSGEWVGYAVAEAFSLDTDDKGQLVRVKMILKKLFEEGKIRTVSQQDDKRMLRKFVLPVAPPCATPHQGGATEDKLDSDDELFR